MYHVCSMYTTHAIGIGIRAFTAVLVHSCILELPTWEIRDQHSLL